MRKKDSARTTRSANRHSQGSRRGDDRARTRCVRTIVAILLAFAPVVAVADLFPVTVTATPASPTSATPVTITGSGRTTSSGVFPIGSPQVTVNGNTIEILNDVTVGPALILGIYSYPVAISPLPAGTYTVNWTTREFPIPPDFPQMINHGQTTFTVAPVSAPPVPALGLREIGLLAIILAIAGALILRR